jgi:hypothetical protein
VTEVFEWLDAQGLLRWDGVCAAPLLGPMGCVDLWICVRLRGPQLHSFFFSYSRASLSASRSVGLQGPMVSHGCVKWRAHPTTLHRAWRPKYHAFHAYTVNAWKGGRERPRSADP